MSKNQNLQNSLPIFVSNLAETLCDLSLLEQEKSFPQVFRNVVEYRTNSNNEEGKEKVKVKRVRHRTKKKKKVNKSINETNPSLHSSTSSSLSTLPEKSQVTSKKKANDRKCQNINFASPTNSNSSNNEVNNKVFYSFTFKQVKTKSVGRFFRKRSNKPFINLRSFLSKIVTTYVCESWNYNQEYGEENLSKEEHGKKNSKKCRWLSNRNKKKKEEANFPDYFKEEDINEGLSNGTLIKGVIRINPKNSKEAYVSNEDTSFSDYLILSLADRNRALEGDEVVIQIKPMEEWLENYQTAKVVFILKKNHSRQIVGKLQYNKDNNSVHLKPRDSRCPILNIPEIYLPTGFKKNTNEFTNLLFLGKLLTWNTPENADGLVIETLGECGNLKVESMSIIKEFNLDITPFNTELIMSLPDFKSIPEKEFSYREDLRKKCIFTIDPSTARDLDDAVSVEILPNGNYEVGVHISDASFFLYEGTELDQLVSKKATTIYMVDTVYHMLPEEMCLSCSLLPGQDKLSISVIWEITPQAEVRSTRFTRSIINSCAKLAYEHAQMVIDNPDKEFTTEDFPQIYNDFDCQDIVKTIRILQSLAKIMRDNRINNGALRINNIKLSFELNVETGEPYDYTVYKSQDSHKLIEEFMLLANISVAQKINEDFPDLAFLRCHEPPKANMLRDLQNKLAKYGIHFDISSSKNLQESLKKYYTEDSAGFARSVALNHLTSRTMKRAQYFCAATAETPYQFRHYALSVPLYTHFTSPIRRYADIMVHRLLAASLNYREKPEWDLDYVQAIAFNCNLQKYQAQRAQESSLDLYLARYIASHKFITEDCVVVDVKEKKIDAIVMGTGSNIRLFQNNCERGTKWSYGEEKLTITFPKRRDLEKTTMIVDLFSVIKVKLTRKDSYHLEGYLVRPKQEK